MSQRKTLAAVLQRPKSFNSDLSDTPPGDRALPEGNSSTARGATEATGARGHTSGPHSRPRAPSLPSSPHPLPEPQSDKTPRSDRPDPSVLSFRRKLHRIESQTYCGRGGLPILLNDPAELITMPIFCKSWDCPKCFPYKSALLREKILAGHPTKLITLTLRDDPGKSTKEVADFIRKSHSKLAERIRKLYGSYEYQWIMELQKNGTPHLHIAARCPYIAQTHLSTMWKAITRSPIVDIRKIRNPRHTAYYVTKYMLKGAPLTAATLEGGRISARSKHYLDPTPEAEPDVRTRPMSTRWIDYNVGAIIQALPKEMLDWDIEVKPSGVVHYKAPPGRSAPPVLVLTFPTEIIEIEWPLSKAPESLELCHNGRPVSPVNARSP